MTLIKTCCTILCTQAKQEEAHLHHQSHPSLILLINLGEVLLVQSIQKLLVNHSINRHCLQTRILQRLKRRINPGYYY